MKAIVIGEKDGMSALLLEDGTTEYREVSAPVGSRIEIEEKKKATGISKAVRVAATMAAAFALVIFGGGYYIFAAPVAYVSVDINPSIEYSISRMNHIVSVKSLNDDGTEIVDLLNGDNIEGDTVSEAVEITGEFLKEKEYIDETGENYILVSVTADDDELADKLTSEIEDALSYLEDEGLSLCIVRATLEERSEAEKLLLSSGRYVEMIDIEGEEAADNTDIVKEYQSKSVKEILGAAEKASDELASATLPEDEVITETDKEPLEELRGSLDINLGNIVLPNANDVLGDKAEVEISTGGNETKSGKENNNNASESRQHDEITEDDSSGVLPDKADGDKSTEEVSDSTSSDKADEKMPNEEDLENNVSDAEDIDRPGNNNTEPNDKNTSENGFLDDTNNTSTEPGPGTDTGNI
ncbi:MAG: hypothetical protein K6G40_03960 [Eubacterium sp.]|nr:hypothetical protein [Eubacterium sp.]